MNSKIIIFEEITQRALWKVKAYLWLGYEVFYVRVSPSIKESEKFKSYLQNAKLKKVLFDFRLHYQDGLSDTESFENVDKFYPAFIKRNTFLTGFTDLIKHERTDLIFKNILNKKLS